jgi:TIR domain
MKRSGKKPTRDFFISYTSADRQWAEWIAAVLESDKHRTVIQSWDFGPGCNFVHEMDQALRTCRRTVLVYSPAYFESLFTQAEWTAAFASDPVGEKRTLLPVRVEACAPGGLLSAIAYVDLVEQSEDEARKRLLMAARPPPVSRRAGVFPGAHLKPARTPIDVARELRDVLNTTLVTFLAQCAVRDKLVAAMRQRLGITEELEFEDFFHKYFARMDVTERRQHEVIRGYTKDVLHDYNSRAFELARELGRFVDPDFESEEEIPSLQELIEHLTTWLGRYKSSIRKRATCLVYVGVHDDFPFPSQIDEELDELIDRAGGRRRSRRSRGPRES